VAPGGVVVVSGAVGLVGAVDDALGLTEAAAGLSTGGVAGFAGWAVVADSDGALVLVVVLAVVAVSALAPVLAPDHQSLEARCLGEAFR
jgi:hypothetical protein